MKSDDFPSFLSSFFMHIVTWFLFLGGIKILVLTCPRSGIANPHAFAILHCWNRSVVKETPTLILIPIANLGFHVFMSHVTIEGPLRLVNYEI